MNEDNEECKSLLIVNESNDAKVTLYISTWLPIPVISKVILPNEKYLHCEKRKFRFKLVANFEDERKKKEFPGPLEWVTDKLIRVTKSLDYIEENLSYHQQEKQICLRKMHLRNELTSTSGKVNLYDILGLDMEVVRKLNIDEQKTEIEKAVRNKSRIWHPDKNFGDGEIAMLITVARETLLDDERRACYHNHADYDEGWFSSKRYKAIFWPDCYAEAGMAKERLDDFLPKETSGFHETSENETAPSEATFRYRSVSACISKMIVIFLLNGKQIKEEVSGSGKIVRIPSDARQVEVRFHIRRPAWGDIMKYDRFKKKWCKPYEPHVFCYEKPPLERTFTISGNLGWGAVMRVSDEYHEETGEMVGYISLTNVKSADHPEEQAEKKVTEARSLALKFVSTHPFCLAAVPYENKDTQAQKPLTMCLYVNTGGKEIPNDFKDAARETFANYEVRFDDFYKRHRCKTVTPNSLSEKERKKKLSEVKKAIKRILHLFEDRSNVTALQASFKVVNSIAQEIPCVRVFVLEKGCIPVGETEFPKRVEEIGYELDVAEGYFQHALGPTSTNVSPLRGGAQISVGVSTNRRAGTLGGFLKDDEGKHYIISCHHILYGPNENSIVHPAAGNSRSIGSYVGGFKDGVEGKFVDAAIAELKEEEVRSITSSNNGDDQCCLYGFNEPTLNGQIGDVNEFSSGEAGALRITKIGQKTGRTDSGIPHPYLFVKNNDETHERQIFLSDENLMIVSRSDENEPFCDAGDSGSLFFGNDGRAWGVYFAVYNDLSEGKTYHLASFLCTCLQTLENITGKNNLQLWVKEQIKSQRGNCHIV